MAFLRGCLKAESGLVLNEHSLKLLMLELCARGGKRSCGRREGTLGGGVELNLRVLCPNRFTGKDKYASLRWNRSLDWFFFSPIRQRCPRDGMDIQVLHSAQQNGV